MFQLTEVALKRVNPVAATLLTLSSPAESEVRLIGSLNVTVMVEGGWSSARGAGVVLATTNDERPPVAPVTSRPYSPLVKVTFGCDGTTSISHLPLAAAGTV